MARYKYKQTGHEVLAYKIGNENEPMPFWVRRISEKTIKKNHGCWVINNLDGTENIILGHDDDAYFKERFSFVGEEESETANVNPSRGGMKFIIDTENKTIEFYGENTISDLQKVMSEHNVIDYKIIPHQKELEIYKEPEIYLPFVRPVTSDPIPTFGGGTWCSTVSTVMGMPNGNWHFTVVPYFDPKVESKPTDENGTEK